MATRYYDYENVIEKCSKNSKIDNDLQKLQDLLIKYYNYVKDMEEKFHGKGYNSSIYKSYDKIYQFIGNGRYDGCWKLIKETIEEINECSNQASRDLDTYNYEIEQEEKEAEETFI